jgi:hypothetical protein
MKRASLRDFDGMFLSNIVGIQPLFNPAKDATHSSRSPSLAVRSAGLPNHKSFDAIKHLQTI